MLNLGIFANMNKIKKFIAIFLVISLPFSANATIANSVGFGIATTGALGAMLGLATGVTIAATGGLALGVLGAAIYFAPDGTTPTSSNSVLMVSLNPNNTKMKTPTGWTSPTSPPATTTSSFSYRNNASTTAALFSTPELACQDIVTSAGFVYHSTTATASPTLFTCNRTGASGQAVGFATAVKVSVCPTGYTIGGDGCALSTPTAVIKPVQNIQEIKRVGNTFVQDPQANPADIAPTSAVNVSSNTVTVNGADGSKSVTTINSDGTTTVTNTAPISGTSNSSQTVAKFSAPDANGDVALTGKTSNTVSGQGDAVGGVTTPPLDLTGLNQESTQANIKGNIQDIKDLMNNAAGNDTSLNDKKTDFDTASAAHQQKIIDIGSAGLDAHGTSWSWFPSIPSGTCSPYSFSLGGSSHTLDYCNGIEKARDVIGYIFYILTAFALFNILTGRREE